MFSPLNASWTENQWHYTVFDALASSVTSICLFTNGIIHKEAVQHFLRNLKYMVYMVDLVVINQNIIQHHADIVHSGICIRCKRSEHPVIAAADTLYWGGFCSRTVQNEQNSTSLLTELVAHFEQNVLFISVCFVYLWNNEQNHKYPLISRKIRPPSFVHEILVIGFCLPPHFSPPFLNTKKGTCHFADTSTFQT